MWIVLEIGGQESDGGSRSISVEQRRIPVLRRVDDVVVELDQVVGRRQGWKPRAYAF